ncbi:MAG: hypothetical protein ACLFUU_02695 [Desulfobacteraceae bacterium]
MPLQSKVIEVGRHEELLSRNGLYHKFYNRQFRENQERDLETDTQARFSNLAHS